MSLSSSGTERQKRASCERQVRASQPQRAWSSLSPSCMPFRNCFLRCLLPPHDGGNAPCIPLALVTDGTGRILRVVDLCRLVICEVPVWAGALPCGRCRALGEAGLSTHRVRRGRQVLLATLHVSDPHRFVLGTILPQRGAAISQYLPLPGACSIHDGSPGANSSRGGSHSHQSNSPWPQRVKLPTGIRSCSEANECDPIATIARLRIPAHP